MSPITRRRLIAAAPASGLAGALVLGSGSALAAGSGAVELVTPTRIQDSRTMEPDKYDTTAQDMIAVPGLPASAESSST